MLGFSEDVSEAFGGSVDMQILTELMCDGTDILQLLSLILLVQGLLSECKVKGSCASSVLYPK